MTADVAAAFANYQTALRARPIDLDKTAADVADIRAEIEAAGLPGNATNNHYHALTATQIAETLIAEVTRARGEAVRYRDALRRVVAVHDSPTGWAEHTAVLAEARELAQDGAA